MVKLPREVSLPGLVRKLVNDEEEEGEENGNKDVAFDKIKIMMMMMLPHGPRPELSPQL